MKSKVLIGIHEFGPLRNQVIEFAPFLLFTGHSGLGKSYANYLVYYLMRSFTAPMWFDIVGKKWEKQKENRIELSVNEIFGCINAKVQDFMRGFLGDPGLLCDVEYRYEYDDTEFDPILKIEYYQSRIDTEGEIAEAFQLSSALTRVNGSPFPMAFLATTPNADQMNIGRAISSYLQKIFFGQQFFKSIILPPARGALVGETYSIKEKVTSTCKMYDYFLRDYDFMLRPLRKKEHDMEDSAFYTNRVSALLHGELQSEKGVQYLILPSGKRIPITSAASSVKELSPFLFYLKNLSDWNSTFCIEEPEAHLHPTMQMDLADLIAACRNKGMMFHMTTHSDYFIMRINQLLRIGKMRKENPQFYKQFQADHMLNRRFYLNEEDVVCYYFSEENDSVAVTKLPFEDGVLPMNTFYEAMSRVSEFDRMLDDEYEESL